MIARIAYLSEYEAFLSFRPYHISVIMIGKPQHSSNTGFLDDGVPLTTLRRITLMNDRRRATLDVWLLAGCQALFMTTSILTITIAGIAASNLLDNLRLATLPQATIPLVAMAATLPAALLIRRIGRRAAFLLGAACGVVSGALCAFALMHESFGLFLAGVAMLGLYQAVATYYRFAVADHAPANLRARSVSFVLAGGVVAAVLGPSLGVATRDLVGTTPYLGSYLVTIALNLVALALLCGLKPHTPVPACGRA